MVQDCGYPEHFFGYLYNYLSYIGSHIYFWSKIVLNNIGNAEVEPFSQGSPRMKFSKILGAEPSKFQKADGKGVAQHQLYRSAGSRCQIVGTGFLFRISIQNMMGMGR